MANCLVTGHRGYIGNALFAKLIFLDHNVIGMDKKQSENGNILDGMGIYEAYDDIDYIFHCACEPRVAYSIENPTYTMMNNIMSTSIVLDFAKRKNVKRVIYSGSSSVVGNGDGPTSPYALQKLTSELETKLYAELYGIDTVTLRYFNVYSSNQRADGPYATAVCNWMQHLRDNKDPFITGDGNQRRDMAHLRDVLSANIFAMEYEGEFKGQHFDVGTGDNISLNEIKEIVLNNFPDVNFNYIDKRKGDVLTTKADISPLKELGWSPEINIRDGITECFTKLKEDLLCT
jgi:nucleoside-diphosphate-sugar epimerase